MSSTTADQDRREKAFSYRRAGAVGAGTVLVSGLLFGTSIAAYNGAFTSSSNSTVVVEAVQESDTVDVAEQQYSVIDTAGVLHLPTLEEGVADIDFYEPTHVVIFTERGTGSSNFNERVLTYMRAHHPELISDDGQKWADGVFIYGLDPDGRHIGTYFGEDRKVSLSKQEDIQEAGFDAAREARWSDAALDGIKRGAELIERPAYANPGGWAAGGIGVLGAGVVGAGSLAYQANRRRKTWENVTTARTSYANVTMDLPTTELNASTIPQTSPFGADILERYRVFHDHYLALHEELEQLDAADPKELNKSQWTKRAQKARDEAIRLDKLDDVIADTNTLLNLQSGWQRAWSRQIEPLHQDLQELSQLEKDDGKNTTSAQSSAVRSAWTALAEFRVAATSELEKLGGGMESGETHPDQALERLAELRTELSDAVQKYYDARADEFTKSSSERRAMDRAMEKAQSQQRRRRHTILDNTSHSSTSMIWTMAAFNSGYRSGTRSVQSSRSSSSSSGGSSTGYGSSGGSFSGAGSSSRF